MSKIESRLEKEFGIRVCRRCGSEVENSELEEYSYSCNDCDEDLYSFETEII